MAIVDDKYMEYDLDIHTYRFTNVLIEDKLNIKLDVVLGGSTEADIFREDVMYFIKDYCIEYTTNTSYEDTKKRIEYRIYENLNGERESLQRAYVEFIRYAKNDEGDLLGIQKGVNFDTGAIIPIKELRGKRELTSRLERILKRSGLLFRGERRFTIPDTVTYGVDY